MSLFHRENCTVDLSQLTSHAVGSCQRPQLKLRSGRFLSGSLKERDVYRKAGHKTTDPANEQTRPQHLQLSIKNVSAIFGTDFDVVVEVRE